MSRDLREDDDGCQAALSEVQISWNQMKTQMKCR